ncbi:AIR synthase family protein [Halapricum hydrolyticum]|uniref:AIR synthase family protein n=1 Tax=Halapricum hydrolyticum TaxID=2979991 RepID=A0AAE3LK68_9EURY|nr:AIR synthase family protein [Halapricum hydrolyticum]MCU4719462.1 AIR synthase family protein [Halapricum hydrolyticum]MCU4728073.1 AIR synthase family protein [Halapricum hydrolyticum]
MVGKLDPAVLDVHVFSRTGASDERVTLGPSAGEDAAAIDLGPDSLVVSSDPISLAAEAAGSLGVPVATNDVAATGAEPAWLTSTIFLPDDDNARLDTLTTQLDRGARELDVAIVGGHAEVLSDLSRPLLSLTAMGRTENPISTGGAEPGDDLLLTAGAGIEGTAILATDFRDELDAIPTGTLDRAAGFFDEISVLDAARALWPTATGLHDPTEGGVLAGVYEIAQAAGATVEFDRERVPIRPETRAICDAMGVDPLRIFGSGALLATVDPDDRERALDALAAAGIEAAVVGKVHAGEAVVATDGNEITSQPRDDCYALWEE